MLAQTRNRRVGSAKYVVCGLRALLRYLYVDGRIDLELAAVVPKVAGWRLAGLPTGLAVAEKQGHRATADSGIFARNQTLAFLYAFGPPANWVTLVL